MEKPLLWGLLFIILMNLTFISAQTFKQNSEVDIQVSCLNVNCSEQVNISVFYPNTSIAINNQEMTNKSGFVNFTFSDTSTLGTYKYITNNGFENTFAITPSGNTPVSQGESIIILSSIFIILLLSSMFLYGGFKSEKVGAKAFLFSIGFIFFFTAILYNVLIVSEVLSNSNLISGFETFYFVIATITGVGVLLLIIITAIILFKAWKTKRGLR